MSQQMRNGYGFDFPVPAGQSMLVSSIMGTYTATIVAGPGKGTALATDSTGGGTYGPYSGGVVIRLQAGENSLIDYDIAVSPALTYAGPLNAGYNSSGDVASAVDAGGNVVTFGGAHPRYFTHLFAGNQLSDDPSVYDISGAGSHALRETDLSVSALWTTRSGYASTLDSSAVDGSRLTRLKLPSLNWDWNGGESLMIWWLGKCTAEGATTNLMGNCRGVAGENGFRVRVASTGQLALTMSEGATATTTFTSSTLLPFDGALHSIGFWFDGARRKGYSYVDETVQVGGNTPVGDMLPTAAQVSAGTDRLILGGDSLLTGAATSAIAQSTRALAILKFSSADTLPSDEQVRQSMLQLRAAPHRTILRGAL